MEACQTPHQHLARFFRTNIAWRPGPMAQVERMRLLRPAVGNDPIYHSPRPVSALPTHGLQLRSHRHGPQTISTGSRLLRVSTVSCRQLCEYLGAHHLCRSAADMQSRQPSAQAKKMVIPNAAVGPQLLAATGIVPALVPFFSFPAVDFGHAGARMVFSSGATSHRQSLEQKYREKYARDVMMDSARATDKDGKQDWTTRVN